MRFVYLTSASLAAAALTACGAPDPDGIIVEVSPEVISSIDGTTTVDLMVIGERTPLADHAVRITVAYTDRNSVDHPIEPIEGVTDGRGAFQAVLSGMAWEGIGTVTAEVVGVPDLTGVATFSVLDRTPPTVEILPPTTDLHVGAGLPLEVQVHVTDEIGVSQVVLEADGELRTTRSTVVASGATDDTVTFRLEIPDAALPGPTITLYALAGDLSGNQAAAVPIVLTVDPTIAIATPPGLQGTQVAEGSQAFLESPRAIAMSPMDGMLYVADNSGNAPCNGGCIRQVDPATGNVTAAAVFVANGTVEGVAFDGTGANLYYSDFQGIVGRMTWNVTSMRYESAQTCNDQQTPQDPYHLVHDATLGVLVADGGNNGVLRENACTGAAATDFAVGFADEPRGVALDAAGAIYVSDLAQDVIYQVDRTTSAVSRFEDRDLDQPYGVEWLAGGASPYADSLMIAIRGDRIVGSTTGNGVHPTAYLRNRPIDIAIDAGTMYIVTEPSADAPGRIFAVTGF